MAERSTSKPRPAVCDAWIVDLHRGQITVLVLVAGVYQEKIYHGEAQLRSAEFPGLDVTANALLNVRF
ncbi:MAG: hypothetical protein AAFV72_10385 [Cyanobacteria bacterium J06635_1]